MTIHHFIALSWLALALGLGVFCVVVGDDLQAAMLFGLIVLVALAFWRQATRS